jgi:hypothetical protein
LGIVSIVGLYTNFKNNSKANIVSYTTLVIAAVGVFLAQQTGTTGGEIRHTEIRTNEIQPTRDFENATIKKKD